MRNFLFFVLLSTASYTVFAQESVVLKSTLPPNSVFEMITKTESSGVMTFKGDKKFEKELKKSGQPSEITMSTNSLMQVTATTLSPINEQIPFIFSYDKIERTGTSNGVETRNDNQNFQGLKVYGKFGENDITIDKYEGPNLDEASKKILSSVVEQMVKGNKLPNNELKIGDSFTQELPMSLPLENVGSLSAKAIVTYALKSIANNEANFDLKNEIVMDMDSPSEFKMEATGNGVGNMVYSIKDELIKSMVSEMTMNMNVTIPGEKVTFHSTNKNKTSYTNQKIK